MVVGGCETLPSNNYPHLQNLIKRDAASYRDEFLQQYQHFKSTLAILQSGAIPCVATEIEDHFKALANFISHVADRYEESRIEFPKLIMEILEKESLALSPSIRRVLVQCLLLSGRQQSRKEANLFSLLELLFKLLRIPDKALRELLYENIVREVRRANYPHRNNALNKKLQNFMYGIFEESSREAGDEERLSTHKILQVIIELYRRQIWNDARTVNVIAEAAIRNTSTKVMVTALNFFVGRFRGRPLIRDKKDSNDGNDTNGSDSDEDPTSEYQNLLYSSRISGNKKKSTQKKLRRALNALHRKENKQESSDKNGLFAAIHLLNDPQGFVERLFSKLKKSNEAFPTKLLVMNVISRVIGAHKLLLLDFYSFLLRYIQPHQQQVTQILAFSAQASHNQLPPDVMEPLVLAIMNNFAAEYCANEVIAAGLNGIREICARCPEAMTAKALEDLCGTFKGYQDKGVVMAARSLISLYREVNPEMLSKRDRGKEVSIALKSGTFTKKIASGEVIYFDAKKAIGQESSNIDGCDDDVLVDDNDDCDDDVGDDDGLEDSGFEEMDSSADEKYEGNDDDSDVSSDINDTDNDEENSQREDTIKGNRPYNDIIRLASERILSPHETLLFRRRILGAPSKEIVSSESDGTDSDNNDLPNGPEEIIDPSSLESTKKKKADYKARMASIEAGRQGRLKYGSRKGKHNLKSSVSNRIKQKTTKNAIMLAHKGSVRAKRKRSFRERQKTLNTHRKKQKLRK